MILPQRYAKPQANTNPRNPSRLARPFCNLRRLRGRFSICAACASQIGRFWTPTPKNTPLRDRFWPIMGADPLQNRPARHKSRQNGRAGWPSRCYGSVTMKPRGLPGTEQRIHYSVVFLHQGGGNPDDSLNLLFRGAPAVMRHPYEVT